MKLELKHLAPYLPYDLKYYPSDESDLFSDLYADNSPYSSWNYNLALEAKDELALKISNSFLTQKKPFFSYEDGEMFLGQFNSSLGFDVDDVYASEVKPILRPLSDLTKEIEVNGKKKIPCNLIFPCDSLDNDFGIFSYQYAETLQKQKINFFLDYNQWSLLFKWHFDVFGLIENNLAININTLNK